MAKRYKKRSNYAFYNESKRQKEDAKTIFFKILGIMVIIAGTIGIADYCTDGAVTEFLHEIAGTNDKETEEVEDTENQETEAEESEKAGE